MPKKRLQPFPSIFYADPRRMPQLSPETRYHYEIEQLEARARELKKSLDTAQLSPIYYNIYQEEYLFILERVRYLKAEVKKLKATPQDPIERGFFPWVGVR